VAEESAYYHNIIKFNIKFYNDDTKINNAHDLRYVIKERQQTQFQEKLYHIISKTFQIKEKEEREGDVDEEVNRRLKGNTDIRKFSVHRDVGRVYTDNLKGNMQKHKRT